MIRRMAALPYPAYGGRFDWARLGDETPDIGFALSGLREIKGCGFRRSDKRSAIRHKATSGTFLRQERFSQG